jgi:hypothetical protein
MPSPWRKKFSDREINLPNPIAHWDTFR